MRLFAALCATVGLLLGVLSLDAWATINAVSFQRIIAVCGDGSGYRKAQYPDGVCSPPDVYWTTDFEDGVLDSKSVVGGWGLQTLERNQAQTTCEYTTINDGVGTGPSADLESRVVADGTAIGADTVDARVGAYFFKYSLTKSKLYHWINGDSTCLVSASDKPRTKMYNDELSVIDFDTEMWLGFSIYLPTNLEHETGYTGTDQRQEAQIISVVSDSSSSHFTMSYYVWDSPYSDWVALVETSAISTTETGGVKSTTIEGCNPASQVCKYYLKLGDVVTDQDLGRWTDFVVRFRANPYATGVTCNPSTGVGSGCTAVSGGQNVSFTGGTGVLQIWKSTGTATPRAMSLVLDLENEPVGLVPGTTYPDISPSPRIYKYGWKKNTTNVTGPVEIGIDEWRMGESVLHGTGYSDVHPGGLAPP